MQLGFWNMAVWIAGFILNVALFAILLYKQRYRTIPWFTFLIGQDSLQTIVLFALHHSSMTRLYAYTYYGFEVLDAILHVLVIWEVSRILIQQHLGLHLYDEIRSYWAAFLLMVVVGISLLSLTSNASGSLIGRIALRIGQVSTIGVGGLLLMVLWLTFFFGVKVRVHAQAIVYGMSLYMLGKVLMQGVVMVFGAGALTLADAWLKPVYLFSLLLWIVCLWRKEPDRALSDEMYAMVRLGRAGINPPLPESVLEEHAHRRRKLTFSLRRKEMLEPAASPDQAG